MLLPELFQTGKEPLIRNDIPINVILLFLRKLEQLIDRRLHSVTLLVSRWMEEL